MLWRCGRRCSHPAPLHTLAHPPVPAPLPTTHPPGPLTAVKHSQGIFQGASALELWIKTDGGKPKITLNIGGSVRCACWGGVAARRCCRRLRAAAAVVCSAGEPVPLPSHHLLAGCRSTARRCPCPPCPCWRAAGAGASSRCIWAVLVAGACGVCACKAERLATKRLFTGPHPCCNSYSNFVGCGGAGAWDLTTLEMKTNVSATQTLCLDSIRLLGAGGGSSSTRRR